jgi:hypothetical protein
MKNLGFTECWTTVKALVAIYVEATSNMAIQAINKALVEVMVDFRLLLVLLERNNCIRDEDGCDITFWVAIVSFRGLTSGKIRLN